MAKSKAISKQYRYVSKQVFYLRAQSDRAMRDTSDINKCK